ncbi:fumarylacetoacetate hydrolase family protein [Sphingosinicella sp. LHD-64]|uniref:fumarylacetoacetate hydrolase family protein n=1 Tax=Sphingosinicella sp. LHD-64 TaxID=3072139 RepID=UPI0028103FC1|nr:fumarylacetoacetate hydrolase family protein [Sphingosinicella sp. LHD-64]MDQ8756534.1 fumarylacetoacetate hydrolase family protein [Sphingosinicella sp. LHD-64]
MIAIPAPTTVPVTGGNSFPVRRVYCVGRNYRAHAIEMGADPDREAPFFFTKPADAVVPSGTTIAYPPRTGDYQHEIELVVAIGRRGRDIPVERAHEFVFGYAVGLDMTRRDLQIEARKAGRPWDMGKAFDESAPCGEISPAATTGPLTGGAISVTVNGETRQSSDLSLLIWNVAEVIADLSTYVELAPGDLIYTGTPEGVGPVQPGDRLVGRIDGLADLEVTIR